MIRGTARPHWDSDKRHAVDQSLRELGAVPPEIQRSIERYVGSATLDALQADALLNTLHVAQLASVPKRRCVRVTPLPSLSEDGDTDGPPMQRMDTRLARQSSQPSPPLPAASSRHNTPFPAGVPGADDMPDIARRVPPPRAPSPLPVVSAALAQPAAADAVVQLREVPEQSAKISQAAAR